ncbi:acVLRF1 family peptidyl-tRNA hydrolase [Nocardioides sp. SYSU DS0651]|uniref:acVLRF1 family peptidyl-tRNA hydrolase n=1 Tax=Nocardioides sp. SYSU DS0651 TaxID=3415955 RepID=UPI003F4B2D12
MGLVAVPVERWPRWLDNFERSHGETALAVDGGALCGSAADGSTFTARLPFSRRYDGRADAALFATAAAPPSVWGVLLVRKGGFAVAQVTGAAIADAKVGRRHVQGRTKAGGQSQQRFSRRRDNQARVAYAAAADHAARVLAGAKLVVAGGDRTAVREVLGDPRLAVLTLVGPWLAVPDPRRAVLERAVADATALQVEVVNAGAGADRTVRAPGS